MRERRPGEETTQEDEARMQPRSNSSESPQTSHPRDRDPRRLERISERAHELYEARGGTDGRDLEDWLKAEREIDGSDPP
jgi:hypothetical protein